MADTTVVQMDNPIITQSQGMTLWSQLRRLPAFTPSTVKWRGNPCVQPGDILSFESSPGVMSRHIVTSQTFHFADGFYSESVCGGVPITLDEINAKTTIDKALNTVNTDINEKVEAATDDIKADVASLANRCDAVERRITQVAADVSTALQDISAISEKANAAASAADDAASKANAASSAADAAGTAASAASKAASEAQAGVQGLQGKVTTLESNVASVLSKIPYAATSQIAAGDNSPTLKGKAAAVAGQIYTNSGFVPFIITGTSATVTVNGWTIKLVTVEDASTFTVSAPEAGTLHYVVYPG